MTTSFEMTPRDRPLLAANGIRSLEDVFAWDAGERLDKPGLEPWRQRWRLRLVDQGGTERVFYLKRFDRPPPRRQAERWRNGCFRLSTAGLEYRNARDLARAGVESVEPAAFGQCMKGPWERRSFILLREMPGESLERWVPAHVPPAAEERDARLRKRRLDALARFVAAFHAAGFVHRDLYLSHVFICPPGLDAPAGREHYALIDVQRVFRPRWRRRRWVVKDLAALDLSTPADRVGRMERLRFLCRYVREFGRMGSARTLARLVGVRAARIARRRGVPSLPAPAGEA